MFVTNFTIVDPARSHAPGEIERDAPETAYRLRIAPSRADLSPGPPNRRTASRVRRDGRTIRPPAPDRLGARAGSALGTRRAGRANSVASSRRWRCASRGTVLQRRPGGTRATARRELLKNRV